MTPVDTIPIIDIQAWTDPVNHSDAERQTIADQVADACRNVGFFAISHHGVSDSIADQAWDASREFFDLSTEEKMKSKTDNEAEYPYGYENSEILSVGKVGSSLDDPPKPDLKETFSIGPSNPQSGMPPRRIPSNPKSLQAALEAYYAEMEQLAMILLKIFARALKIDEDFFTNKMDHHFSALRILNYFPVKLSQIQPGQLRASAHTDYGTLTILKSGGPGLQVKKDNTDDSTSNSLWIDVPYLENVFVINLGDMMRQWTNDRWLSTLHRVVVTEEDAQRRQSMAFFCNVNGDCICDPRDLFVMGQEDKDEEAKYDPISAKEHLMKKHLASMGISSAEEGKNDSKAE